MKSWMNVYCWHGHGHVQDPNAMRMSRASLDRAQRNDEVYDLSMGIMNNCPLGETTACREYQPQLPLAGSLSEPCKSRSLMGTTLISCLVACCALQGITMHLQILVSKSLKVCFNNNHIVINHHNNVSHGLSFFSIARKWNTITKAAWRRMGWFCLNASKT